MYSYMVRLTTGKYPAFTKATFGFNLCTTPLENSIVSHVYDCLDILMEAMCLLCPISSDKLNYGA